MSSQFAVWRENLAGNWFPRHDSLHNSSVNILAAKSKQLNYIISVKVYYSIHSLKVSIFIIIQNYFFKQAYTNISFLLTISFSSRPI